MAFLKVMNGLNPGQEFPLEGDCSIMGRHPDCDIVVDVGAVSRQHAQVLHENGDYFVEDLKSRNGTFVNGEQVEGRRKLVQDDQLKICELVFTFLHDAPVVSEPSGDKESSLGATMFDDSESSGTGHSTIMSKIDVSSTGSSLHVSVNPEVKLKAMLEITRNLAQSLELDAVLPKILDSLFKVFVQADRGFLVLQDEGRLIPKAVKYRKSDDDAIRISRTIVRQVMETKEAILSADATQDSQFAMSESIADFRIRAMMCAPLISSDGRALGVIQVDTMDQRSRFQQDDLEVLASVASQAAFAVENAQFHEQALQSKQLERDLQLAHRVQQGFLPDKGPDIPGYEFFNYYNPASEVGGDSYDYVPLPGNRLAVIVADVSGKGVSAALLMAKCSSEARYLLASQDSPAKAISKLAAGFGGRGWDDRFITFILQVLNFETHKVTIVNAGHMAPFLRHADGTVEEVGEEYTGVPVGVDDEFEYEQFEIDLKPGETLTSFTDGFSEAQNAKDEFYGMERLLEQHKAPISGVQELGDRVVNEVSQFVGNHKQFDDMCLLCFGRTK